MLKEIDRRIQILEEKIEYQDKTIDALNDVVIEQQSQLNTIEEQLGRVRSILAAMHERPLEGDDPPPPHY